MKYKADICGRCGFTEFAPRHSMQEPLGVNSHVYQPTTPTGFDFEKSAAESWEQAKQTLEADGEDVDELLKAAGKNASQPTTPTDARSLWDALRRLLDAVDEVSAEIDQPAFVAACDALDAHWPADVMRLDAVGRPETTPQPTTPTDALREAAQRLVDCELPGGAGSPHHPYWAAVGALRAAIADGVTR